MTTTMLNADDNPRPLKRVKLDADVPPTSSLSTLTASPASAAHPSPSGSSRSPTKLKLSVLPQASLLVSLPGLLAHPPNHKCHTLSLQMSLNALRRCLSLPALSPELECRAWTGVVEVGMRIIGGGLHEKDEHMWARGIEAEVCVSSHTGPNNQLTLGSMNRSTRR